MANAKPIKYKKYGSSNQLVISNIEHLRSVLQIDTALWVAINAPFETINCPQSFLELLDVDKNKRITCDDLKTTISWSLETWSNYQPIMQSNQSLTIADINTKSAPGSALYASAQFILEYIEKDDRSLVTADDIASTRKLANQLPVSESGITLPSATDDETIAEFISDVISVTTPTPHPSGKPGLSALELARFENEILPAPPEEVIKKLGTEKIEKYKSQGYFDDVRVIFSEKNIAAEIMTHLRLIEKAILISENLFKFANNFVSFPYLYRHDAQAIFEMGSMVIDGRRFNLAVKVTDRAKHVLVAKSSNIFILYVEISPDNPANKMTVAIPVTSGGRGNLCIGKRGVFYDTKGKEFDAVVVDIIENPISFKEALIAPFKRIGKILSGKIESITAAAEQKLDSTTANAVKAISDNKTDPAPVQPSGKMSTPGMLVGVGVAIAALGSAATYIAKTFANAQSVLRLVITILIAVGAVILMTAIIAFLKLRKRDISSILEGSGWGINARMRLTFSQSRFFTQRPRFPFSLCYFLRRLLKIFVILAIIAGIIYGSIYLLKANSDKSEDKSPKSEKIEIAEQPQISQTQ